MGTASPIPDHADPWAIEAAIVGFGASDTAAPLEAVSCMLYLSTRTNWPVLWTLSWFAVWTARSFWDLVAAAVPACWSSVSNAFDLDQAYRKSSENSLWIVHGQTSRLGWCSFWFVLWSLTAAAMATCLGEVARKWRILSSFGLVGQIDRWVVVLSWIRTSSASFKSLSSFDFSVVLFSIFGSKCESCCSFCCVVPEHFCTSSPSLGRLCSSCSFSWAVCLSCLDLDVHFDRRRSCLSGRWRRKFVEYFVCWRRADGRKASQCCCPRIGSNCFHMGWPPSSYEIGTRPLVMTFFPTRCHGQRLIGLCWALLAAWSPSKSGLARPISSPNIAARISN